MTEKDIKNYEAFIKATKELIKGLTLSAMVDTKKYLAAASK